MSLILPKCAGCKFIVINAVDGFAYNDGKVTKKCDAYPNGIPFEIWTNKVDHSKPYPGDNGIRFEPR
ncbi:MAG: hypothetical protein H7A24_00005 [Leptospiraceae bacterium]|nr:hypothetical protein [Leptospiraceae bacterium]